MDEALTLLDDNSNLAGNDDAEADEILNNI